MMAGDRDGREADISQRRWYLSTVVLVLAVGALYLFGAARCRGFGFPLDDAWIHQTYARSLAETGRFAYQPGQVSTGSTSPLWTLLLAVGYRLGIAPFIWTYLVGGASWLLTSWTAAALTGRLFPRQPGMGRWVGLACVVEWHLAWAAFSGMETMLFTWLALLLIERWLAGTHPFVLGLVGGLLFATRPEGMVLVALVAVATLIEWLRHRQTGRERRITGWLKVVTDLAAGFLVLSVPYVVLNQIASGQPLPSTFYAKQAEYRALLDLPLWVRLWHVMRRPLVGAQVMLLPGFVWQGVRWLRRQAGRAPASDMEPSWLLVVLPIAWWAVYLGIYALLLPVDYQYGRYLMPTVPFLLIYGIAGTARWLQPWSQQVLVRVLSRAAILAVGCLFIAFLLVGGQAFAGDVCFINGEMVDAALWVRVHTPPETVIAAHDIGAIGYFAQRPLLDLAGLITPDVIPFIRDEQRLLEYVVHHGASYLITFPSWYPNMVADERLQLRYQAQGQAVDLLERDHMAVYQIRR